MLDLRFCLLAAAAVPAAAFQLPASSTNLALRTTARSAHGTCVAMKADGGHKLRSSRAEVSRLLFSGLAVAPLVLAQGVHAQAAVEEEAPAEAEEAPAAAAEEAAPAAAEGGEDEQILSFDGINYKKLGITGGAFLVADVISALVTGRSVLKIIKGNADPEDWKTKAVDKLLEKEKQKAAERMGVSATTSAKPRAPSATGEYAKTDPFEIAKEKYKKKPAIEDLQKDLSAKLDKKKPTGFDAQDEEEED